MRFLLPTDYTPHIRAEVLDVLCDYDTTNRLTIEQASIEEMRSYLTHRYDTEKVFFHIAEWNAYSGYSPGSHVTNPLVLPGVNNSTIYTSSIQVAGDMPPPLWSNLVPYASNAIVYYDDDTTTTGTWQNTSGSPTTAPPPQPQWTKVSDLWIPGSPRNPLIVQYTTDIVLYHLHKRANPRDIPQLRVIAYDQAMSWLKAASKETISPNLPRYASPDIKNEHHYVKWGSNPYRNLQY